MESLTTAAQAFLAHLESGGGDSAAEFLEKRGESDPETVEVLSVLAGLHGRPHRPDRIGPYRLERELGRGAQGVVYLAHDPRLDRRVALKVLAPEHAFGVELQGLLRDLEVAGPSRLLETVGSIRRFRREVHAATRLDHPGICSVYEAGAADGASYIAMRYVEGETLATRIAAPATRAGVDAVCELVAATARALHEAHEAGLVHRDIKPGNIMVAKSGDPVILDFGLARHVDADLSQSGTAVGTPVYMAPEQITARAVDARADVYALGVVLYECLSGRRPFDAPTLDALYRDILQSDPPPLRRANRVVPPELATVVATALRKEPGRRYRTAVDLADDLERVRARRPIRARPPSVWLRLRRWVERSPALAASVLAIFLLLAGGFAVTAGLLGTTRTALDAKSDALRRARALALANASAVELDTNPQAALLLAREAARLELLPAVVTALHDALNRPAETLIVPHEGRVHGVAYSPSGDRLVTACGDHTARVFDVAGNELAVLRGHTNQVAHAVFSPDGRRILTSSWDKTARVWDADGTSRLVLEGHAHNVVCGALSPDGAWIATASRDRTVRLWRADGTPSGVVLRHGAAVGSVEFSADGRRLLTASWDKTVREWDLAGEEVRRVPHRGRVSGATYSPDGEHVLTWGAELRVVRSDGTNAYRSATGYLVARFSPDGRRMFVGAGPLESGIWTIKGRAATLLRGHEAGVLGAAFSPDGTRVATASTDLTMRVWNPAASEAAVFRCAPPCGHAALSPDGTRVAAAAGDRTVRLWRIGAEGETVLRGHEGPVRSVSFSPAGDRILTASTDRTARIWDLDGRELRVLKGHASMVLEAAFSPDGAHVVTASGDGTARVWDADGNTIRAFEGKGWVMHAGFTPEGDAVLTARETGAVRIHGLDGALRLALPKQPVASDAAFAPDGGVIAVVSRIAPRVRLWGRDGERLGNLPGHSAIVTTVAFSPDGKLLVTAGGDGAARIWTRDGAEVAALTHRVPVASAVFSSDGRYVLTAAADGYVRLWHVRADELLRVADARIVRDLTPAERRRFAELLVDD